jgi:penicillin amidase
MGSFGVKDARALACADRSWPAELFAVLSRHAQAAAAVVLVFALFYLANVVVGLHTSARSGGTMRGLPVDAPVAIVRDERGIPHIRARTLHDLFFAQGFAEGSDRLFQMEVSRRYAYGTLSEIAGSKALAIDEDRRAVDIRHIVARQWRHLDPFTRSALQAFSDGVNAAMRRQPLPVEFRMLLYAPARWTPQDSLAVSMVAMLELSDSWRDIESRSDAWQSMGRACFDLAYPLSDPRYDVTVDGTVLKSRPSTVASSCFDKLSLSGTRTRPRMGSNAWAAGGERSADGHALIANDPHVDLTIPGIWYVVDLQAPGFHAAGAVIPGLPGVDLGHNERIAWAVTNAQVATTALYHVTVPPARDRIVERFGVRFGRPVYKTYYRDAAQYSIPDGEEDAVTFVRWPPYAENSSPVATSLAIDRARTAHAAMQVLASYRGSPENFIVADTSGSIAYHLAGDIPADPAWGRYVHPQRDIARPLPLIPFAALPSRTASSNAILLSANNRMYRRGYPYRLSATFEPPYRAYRIAELLHARARYTPQYFARMQLDTYSPVDAEVARAVSAIAKDGVLARWDGRFSPRSRAATLEHELRDYFTTQGLPLQALLLELRRHAMNKDAFWPPFETPAPWRIAGSVDVDHPLSGAWYGMMRGRPLPGDGDEYTVHLQEPGFAQGFRAVWDVGSWDKGGIAIPSGESGQPGSRHYDDLARGWIAGRLAPLPFSGSAVERARSATLVLAR